MTATSQTWLTGQLGWPWFGATLALHDQATALIGAPLESARAGAVYVFAR